MIMESILQFQEKYRFLSNFWVAPVTWEGITYPSSECAYQAAKSLDSTVRLLFTTMTPSKAKREGKKIKLREDWEEVKLQVMYEIVLAKFTQNADLKELLLDTGYAYLEEGNYHHDHIWGVCPPITGTGRNELGKILIQVRRELSLDWDW